MSESSTSTSTTSTTYAAIEDQVLDAVKFGQQAIVDGVRAVTETVKNVIPAGSVPFADSLPKPSEYVERAFSLSERLLANQKQFTQDLLAAAGV